MTTHVKITHEGGDHDDIMVMTAHPETGVINGPAFRLEKGMSVTLPVYSTQGIAIREIPKERAVGAVGQVGVSITPHVPETTTYGTQLELDFGSVPECDNIGGYIGTEGSGE